jgi:hypothetical protein
VGHDSRLLGEPFEETPPIPNHLAADRTRVGITRIPVRPNDDGVVLDADFDFGIRFDVNLLENRSIEDQTG